MAVLQHDELVCKVGKDFIGRVVSVTGDPLDGKGPVPADSVWPDSYTHLRAHETVLDLVFRFLLEKKNTTIDQ